MSSPKYSVIVAASLHEKILASVLNSIHSTSNDVEIIIGCSEESEISMSIAASFAAQYFGEIRIAQHGNIACAAADINAALDRCRGEFVFVASEPSELVKVDYQSGANTLVTSDLGWATWSKLAHHQGDCLTKLYHRLVPCRLLIARRSYLDALGKLDDSLRWFAFWDYLLRSATRSCGALIESDGLGIPVARSESNVMQFDEGIRVLRRWQRHAGVDPIVAVHSLAGELGVDNGPRLDRAQQTVHMPCNEVSPDLPGANLTFLLSLPRSGSTLLQRMIANHPDMHSVPEPWIMLPLAGVLGGRLFSDNYELPLAQQAITGFVNNFDDGEKVLHRTIRQVADDLYRRIMHGSGKSRFLDKTPRYFRIVETLATLYPRARFIILTRHPGAILSSMLKTWCDDDLDMMRNNVIYRDLIEGPAMLVRAKEQLGSRAINISYEQLIGDTETTMRSICSHLGLDWSEFVLNYRNDNWPLHGFGDNTHITEHESAVENYQDSWRSHLSTSTKLDEFARKCLDEIGEQTLSALGYTAGVSGNGNPIASADELTSEGERLYADGQYDAAARAFNDALNIDPLFVNAHNNLGVLRWQHGDGDSAAQSFGNALDCDPSNMTALVNLLDVLDSSGRITEALPRLDSYVQQHPDEVDIVKLRANILQRGNQMTAEHGRVSTVAT
ncbi:MAG: tetratricopeptide (TPR) repeat protein [Gammaproteobacteria bacterium]|jgi:tetratricopeptide (TPR) repeat protein